MCDCNLVSWVLKCSLVLTEELFLILWVDEHFSLVFHRHETVLNSKDLWWPARLPMCESCFGSLESKITWRNLRKKKKTPTIISVEYTQIIKLHALSESGGFFSTVFPCISISLPLSHTHTHTHTRAHAYSTQHTECAGGFIRKMVLILLSALTNSHLAPWNICFASCQSCFSHIGRMKLEIMWDLRLFSKQRGERFCRVYTYCMLRLNYCIRLHPIWVKNWQRWCDT